MASSSKNLKPYPNGAEALEKQKRQLRCINRRCSYGDKIINAIKLVCTYYRVKYKPGKKVCITCFTKCIKHYKILEKKWKEGKCIFDTSFPNFDSHIVIDDSSSEEAEEQEQQKPNTSRAGLLPDQDVKNAIDSAITYYFNENKHLIEHHVKLCDEFINKEIEQFLVDADELDKFASDLEDEMTSFRNELFCSLQPIATSSEPENINELEENKDGELEEVKMPQEESNKLIREVKTPKEVNRCKLDKSDKEDIITIKSTACVVPANLPLEGSLEYAVVETGQTVYAMKSTVKDPWCRGKIISIYNEDCMYVLFQTGKKLVTTKQIAYYTLNPVRFSVGSRVIANFTDPNSKRVDAFYAGLVAEPPKTLNNFRYLIFFDGGFVQYRQHQDIRLIARQTSKHDVWRDVEENSQDFIKSYFEKYPEFQMVKLTNQDSVRVEYQCQWQIAKVLEVDASLVKLYYTDFKHYEWIYRGSPRLNNIFEKQSKSEKFIQLRRPGLAYLRKPCVEFTGVEEEPSRPFPKCVARKSTKKNSTNFGDITQNFYKNKTNATRVIDLKLPKSVPTPNKYSKHKCNPLCITRIPYSYDRTKSFSMLTIPLIFGFARYLTIFNKHQQCILYRSPCGVTIRNIKQMMEYLIVTKSAMTIDLFNFNSWVKPFAEHKTINSVQFLEDISGGKEFKGIPCVNIIDSTLPPKINYITTRQPMPGVNINVETEFLCGCDCTDNCQDKSKCACWQMTIEGQKILPNLYKDPNFGYDYRRLPKLVLTGIYECNKTCKCSRSCLNRVVQNPMSQKLQLFMTEKKKWGVQCLNDIPQGSFICIYVGCLFTETDANEGGKNDGDEYLTELDYIEVVEKMKEGYESGTPCSDDKYEIETNQSLLSDEHYPSTSDGRRSKMSLRLRKCNKSKTKKHGKHVQVLSKLNARKMKNKPEPPKSVRDLFGNNESVYVMNSLTSGNIGRFINHSCTPNTFVQNVFVDTHDLRFPWISFFALHYIKAGTEITWDYSYVIGSVPGKKIKCHCETFFCRGRLL